MQSVRDFFGVLFTPLARRLGGVEPNTLTAVSIGLGVAAGVAFWLAERSPWYYALAALLIALSGAADSLDGLVARMYDRVTPAGDFFDHAGDRFVEVGVIGGLAFSPRADPLLGLGVLVLTLLHSYLGTQIEATFGRRDYRGPGKAEQFVALVGFAALLAMVPDASFPLGARRLSLADAFFWALGAATLAGVASRLRYALARATPPGRPADPRSLAARATEDRR